MATYLDKFRRPCAKEKACYVGTILFDAEGKAVLCADGTCGSEENKRFTEEEIEYYSNVKKAYDDVCMGKTVKIACYKYGLPPMTIEELRWKYFEGKEAHIISSR